MLEKKNHRNDGCYFCWKLLAPALLFVLSMASGSLKVFQNKYEQICLFALVNGIIKCLRANCMSMFKLKLFFSFSFTCKTN